MFRVDSAGMVAAVLKNNTSSANRYVESGDSVLPIVRCISTAQELVHQCTTLNSRRGAVKHCEQRTVLRGFTRFCREIRDHKATNYQQGVHQQAAAL